MIKNKDQLNRLYKEDDKQIFGELAKIFIIFALVCFATSLMFSTGSRVIRKDVSIPETIGPFKSSGKNVVYRVDVQAKLPTNSWSFVTGQVLDKDQNYLFAFGKELWKESGRDADGYWTEQSVDYDMKFTLASPGDYYIKFVSETGQTGHSFQNQPDITKARVTLSRKRGSTLPHMWAGIFALIIALVFNEMKSQTIGQFITVLGEHA